MNIISLVPSITETLFDFGLDENSVVGRTKFCIHPKEKVHKIPVIGGTKNLNLTKIKALNPDLIIANKEENEKSQIIELQKDFNVWITDIENLQDNENFLSHLGETLNQREKAQCFIEKIRQNFNLSKSNLPKKAAYLIWKNPYMTVGSDTFIHHVLENLGFENIFKNQKRYPVVDIESLSSADYIFLSTEPFPFKESEKEALQKIFPKSKVILVDGETFSWYGTHLAHCGNCLKEIADL